MSTSSVAASPIRSPYQPGFFVTNQEKCDGDKNGYRVKDYLDVLAELKYTGD